MTLTLRVFLLVCAALVLVFIFRKIKRSEFEITDSIFWFFFVAVLALFALFPPLVECAQLYMKSTWCAAGEGGGTERLYQVDSVPGPGQF